MTTDQMIYKVHEAMEGRYDLTGYDLQMIHSALCEYDNSNNQKNKLVIPDVSGTVCPICNDFLMNQVNSTNKNCVRCGETIRQTDH